MDRNPEKKTTQKDSSKEKEMIELIATIFGLLCVWLTIKQNIWCWPTGIIQVILYIFVFYETKLYSDALLQIIYIFLQAYGWYHWIHGKNDKTLPVTTLSKREFYSWGALIITGTLLWGYLMKRYTDAAVPYPDAAIVVISLVAQWLLALKKVESWVMWITVDVLAIGVYFYKGLYLTTGLYSVFLVLAIIGLFKWTNEARWKQNILSKMISYPEGRKRLAEALMKK